VLVISIIGISIASVGWLAQSPEPLTHARRAAECAIIAGFVAAAVIEIVRRATILQGAFNRFSIVRFFGDDITKIPHLVASSESESTEARTAHTRANMLAESNSGLFQAGNLYFSMYPDQLTAQLSDLGDRALTSPSSYRDILVSLLGDGSVGIVDRYIAMFPRSADLAPAPSAAGSPAAPSDVADPSTGGAGSFAEEEQLAAEVTSLKSLLEARLDGFQQTVSKEWRLYLRLTALAVSGAAAAFIAAGIQLSTAGVMVALSAGLTIGAVTAWTTNDVLSIIAKYAR
jgi:hypothetical protein